MNHNTELANELHSMANNCSEAAERLRRTDNPADLADAAALAAAGAIHRAEAERLTPPAYWWQDKN